MRTFRVTWEIDIEADTPIDAVFEALDTMRDKESTAVVFKVKDRDTGQEETIDLAPEEWEEI